MAKTNIAETVRALIADTVEALGYRLWDVEFTKIGADRLAESFYRSFDLPVSIVRPFNTYGPRQSARAVATSALGWKPVPMMMAPSSSSPHSQRYCRA